MTDDNEARLKAIESQLTFADDDGVVANVAMLATAYFEQPFRREAREAVAACCNDYFHRFGRHLRWALHPDTERMERFGEGKGSAPATWLPSLGEDESFGLIYHGGEWHLGADAYSLKALGVERRDYATLGYLSISVPVSELLRSTEDMVQTVLGLCHRLKPVSGYAGVGMTRCADYRIATRYSPIEYELAQRFPGLEIDSPVTHTNWLSKGEGGIKGVNWLTVVGDRFLARLGGVDAVCAAIAALDTRYVVHRFDGGVLIQAGPRPELGAVEMDDWPVLYVKLAKLLKPIRVLSHDSFHWRGAEPRFDRETSEAWLRRFEER